jgi:Tol biopolymer transport system component
VQLADRRGYFTVNAGRRWAVAVLVFCGLTAGGSYGQVKLFIPGEVPSSANVNLAPAFSPDGRTVYFTAVPDKDTYRIMVSRLVDGRWSAPDLAAFSGHSRDLEPAFAPTGRFLIFASNRAESAGGPAIDGHYNRQVFPGGGGHLWEVHVRGDRLGKPELLPGSINASDAVFSPAVTADGSLYFMRAAEGGGVFHIYRAQFRHGHYLAPVRASFSNTTYGDFDPAVAPDESYLIFSSGRPPAPHATDLFIVFRTQSGWSDPIDLRTVLSDDVHGVEARLSPDGRTLYFTGPPTVSAIDPHARPISEVSLSDLLASHGISTVPGRTTGR